MNDECEVGGHWRIFLLNTWGEGMKLFNSIWDKKCKTYKYK